MSGSVVKRALAFGLTTLVVSSAATLPARAENAMGYRMLSEQEAATLPHNHGALGLDVSRAQQIVDAVPGLNLPEWALSDFGAVAPN